MSGLPGSGEDSGLLAPVRAGTPVEAVTSDLAWLQAMLDAEAALARAQARLGVLPDRAAAVISQHARAELYDVRAIALAARETANPVVPMVRELTRAVAERDPASAEYVHRGSTSQDIMDTAAMLVASRALAEVESALGRTVEALARLARKHRDTVMAGRTLARHAVPTTFGLKAAGWHQLAREAMERIRRVRAALPVSLGGAAGTLAGYLEYATVDGGGITDPDGYVDSLVDAYAAETGLRPAVLPWHTLRTPIADLAAVLAVTCGALGKLAVDVLALTRTEVDEVSEPDAAGRGVSSAMPQKRNPVLATLLRAAALQMPAIAAALTAAMLSEDERAGGVWQSEWQLLRDGLRLAGGAAETAAELAAGLTVHRERMRVNVTLTGGQIVAERLAAVLTPIVGRATARTALTEASAEAASTGRQLAEVLGEHPEIGPRVDADRLRELCNPAGYVGAAPHLVDRALNCDRPPTLE